MPWGIHKVQKNQEIQDFLDAGGNTENQEIYKIKEIQYFLDAVGNPENQENPGNPVFPGYHVESRKIRTSRKSTKGWES